MPGMFTKYEELIVSQDNHLKKFMVRNSQLKHAEKRNYSQLLKISDEAKVNGVSDNVIWFVSFLFILWLNFPGNKKNSKSRVWS